MGPIDRGHSAAAYLLKDLVGPELGSVKAGHAEVRLAWLRSDS
jgi:hypothetical protein